ncbi:hypothetical protein EBBID32_12820 [Sphingobium indicum BiD32]|uniref:Uncharacterized protein n=1 Tax=Sphingobium indicum BiD32 TaxID=1301087 RepID=N1MN76_9SPHN|nr:single-stranded DNA-binding protein [Sphingobium indicum]CCW16943.1 hypothetical protein EBBID32_12820 [Sphingobium indicum BiD32]
MIDFKRLAEQTPEDRAARDAKRERDEKDADAKRRAEWSKTTIDARLSEDVEMRSTPSGDTIASLRCIADNGDTFTAIYWLPPHRPDAAERIAATLRAGLGVCLAGYWKRRQWTDRDGNPRQVREFQAQYVAPVRDPVD